MTEYSNNHFNRFTAKSNKPSFLRGFGSFIDLYLDYVEFDLIPNTIFNKQTTINIAKFPQHKRSDKLIEKARSIGLEVYCIYFSERIYHQWKKRQKVEAKAGYEHWVESVFFELLTADGPHLYDKENDKILYC
ncbi:hypothetical protein [Neisseria sp. Ec49-e6-T10]|uniref:hypothetical protein n=1 Tax=Neisseria sp. Ec49-e6-T10 TaxID=3140744 RepID=UPI003EB93E19